MRSFVGENFWVKASVVATTLALALPACRVPKTGADGSKSPLASTATAPTPAGAQAPDAAGVVHSDNVPGASVTAPPGTLAVGSTVDMESAPSIVATAGIADMHSLGPAVDVTIYDADGHPQTELKTPLTIQLALDAESSGTGAALTADGGETFEHLCVLAQAGDATRFVWRRDALLLGTDRQSVSLQTTRLGAFEVALCDGDDFGDFKDAVGEGVAGEFRLLAAIDVDPATYATAFKAANLLCVTLASGDGAAITTLGLPLPSRAFSAHLVDDLSALDDAATYQVVIAALRDTCGSDGAKAILAAPRWQRFGPFTFNGKSLKTSPLTGKLGAASGDFALPTVALDFSGAVAVISETNACITITSGAAGEPLARDDYVVSASAMKADGGVHTIHLTSATAGPLQSSATFGASCAEVAASSTPSGVGFGHFAAEVSTLDGTSAPLPVHLISVEARLYADLAAGDAAAPHSASVKACLEIFSDVDPLLAKPLGTWQIVANPPTTTTAAGVAPTATSIDVLLPETAGANGRYQLKVYAGGICGSGSMELKPAVVGTVAELDFEQPKT